MNWQRLLARRRCRLTSFHIETAAMQGTLNPAIFKIAVCQGGYKMGTHVAGSVNFTIQIKNGDGFFKLSQGEGLHFARRHIADFADFYKSTHDSKLPQNLGYETSMIPVLPGIISSNPQTRKDGAGAFHSIKTGNITEKSAGYKTNANP
jgi:hypothetical protein